MTTKLNRTFTLLDTYTLTMEAYDTESDFSKGLEEDLGYMPDEQGRLEYMFEGIDATRYLNSIIQTIVEDARSRMKSGIAWVVLAGHRTGWNSGDGALYFRPNDKVQLSGDDIRITIEADGTLEVTTSDHDGTTYMTLYLFSNHEEHVSTYKNGYANSIKDEGAYYDDEMAKHYMRKGLELKRPYAMSNKTKLKALSISEYE